MLTSDEVNRIAQAVVRGETPVVKGAEAEAFLIKVTEEIEEMRAKGITVELPFEVDGDGNDLVNNEFDESEHPRAEDGKFTGGAGNAKLVGAVEKTVTIKGKDKTILTGGTWKNAATGADLPAHLSHLKIPPAWKGVQYALDPSSDLLVAGKDGKGRDQRIYSAQHAVKAASAKFARVKELLEKRQGIIDQNMRAMSDPNKKEEAACLALVIATGVRPGSDDDTGAEKKAHGATTLEGRHIVPVRGVVHMRFVGKKGVDLDIPVEDKTIAKMLLERKAAAGNKGRLFDTDAGKVSAHAHGMDGGGFKTKDFRTALGTATALSLVQKTPAPPADDPKKYKKAVMGIAKQVAEKLGNTPTIALQAYIDPTVFAQWRRKSA